MKREIRFGFTAFCLLVTGMTATGQRGQDEVSGRPVAETVPTEFKELYSGNLSTEKVPAMWAGLPYNSITLERTACYGPCQVYRVTFHRGGRVDLNATNWQGKKGDFVGYASILDYGKLCHLLTQSRFDMLASQYGFVTTDSPTYIVTAVGPDNTKRVSENGSFGPVELWGIQQAIDGVAQSIRWTAK
jgi:hypothetical protein